jgi:hypothetical protein
MRQDRVNQGDMRREVDGDCVMESCEIDSLRLAEIGARFGAGVEHDAVYCRVLFESSCSNISLLHNLDGGE